MDIVASSQVRITLAVESDSAAPELLADLERFAQVSCEPRQAIVSVVGENLRGRQGIAASVFGSVAAAGVNVRMISQGASEINISLRDSRGGRAGRGARLHSDLFAEKPGSAGCLRAARSPGDSLRLNLCCSRRKADTFVNVETNTEVNAHGSEI